jgi:hypothetical protein
MATEKRLKIAKKYYFALFFFSIKTDFNVLQLGLKWSKRVFSIGYTLPYDPPQVIFSLSHVRNFLGDETLPHPSNPSIEGGTTPFWQIPEHFLTKNSVWGLNKVIFYCFRPQRGRGSKSRQNTSI